MAGLVRWSVAWRLKIEDDDLRRYVAMTRLLASVDKPPGSVQRDSAGMLARAIVRQGCLNSAQFDCPKTVAPIQ
jgi:hypothetical protein